MPDAGRGTHLVGEHDFTSFCRHPGTGQVRRSATCSGSPCAATATVVTLGFRANAFLHQMVRTVVGTLVRVGEGSSSRDDVRTMLDARERSVLVAAGAGARAHARSSGLRQTRPGTGVRREARQL